MTPELEAIRDRLLRDIDRIVATLDGVDAEDAAWAPVSGGSSLLAIARHVLGGTEQVVTQLAGGTFLRDRDSEFLAPGSVEDVRSLTSAAKARIAAAFERIDPATLDRSVPPPGAPPARRLVPVQWTGGSSRQSGRDKLLERVAHVAEHAGHAELTRDLIKARRPGL